MTILRLALATDDGVNYTSEHFGSAKKYEFYTYSFDSKELSFEKEVINTTTEEETHGDSVKAKEVSEFMKETDVFVGFAMGPNIKIIRKKFVPVISREKNIQKSLELIKDNIEFIKKETKKEKGEERDIIFLKNEEDETKTNINLLNEIKHPEINKSLVELGMIGFIEKKEEGFTVELKIPFLEIPIKQHLIDSIIKKLKPTKTTVVCTEMTNEEKEKFFVLSKANWAL